MRRTIGPIVFPFPNLGLGGSHMSTFLLARGLEELGIPTVVVTAEGTRAQKEAQRRGLNVVAEPARPKASGEFLGGIAKDLAALPQRVRWLRSMGGRPIVHCSDSWIVQGWGLAAKVVGAPVVYHQRRFVHGRWVDRLRTSLADRVISISEVCAANFLAANGPSFVDRLDVITNPFERDGAAPGGRPQDFPPAPGGSEALKVGFVGNFERRKRPDFFIEAAAAVKRRVPNTRFLLFGADAEILTADLQQRAERLKIAATVEFLGFRTPPEANYRMLDLLVAPALAEPFGRTLLESVLSGTPYVATDDGGHREIFVKWGGGRLVPEQADADEFGASVADAMGRLAELRLSEDVLARYGRELSPRAHAAKVLEVYSAL